MGFPSLLSLGAVAVLSQAPIPGAPSDEPAPNESTTVNPVALSARGGSALSDALNGFDLLLTLYDSSGVFFGAEGYTNSLTLQLDPSYALGRRHFGGTWAEGLTLSARLPVEVEITGSDPRFRGTSFASPGLLSSPEQLPIVQPGNQIDGAFRRAAILGDAWLNATHESAGRIPVVDVDVSAGFRATVPTSIPSRNQGLVSAVSVGAWIDRTFGRATVSYALRPTKYIFSRPVGTIAPLEDSVLVNGREEPVFRPQSTALPNPNWAVIHGPAIAVTLPARFSLFFQYLLFHVAPLTPNSCLVEGVPTANVCADGALVGDARPGAMRVEHWLYGAVNWEHGWITTSLGLSTYRPLRHLDGTLSQPFFVSDRNNFTTLSLSVSVSTAALAEAMKLPENNP